MTKFIITCTETMSVTYEIEAENREAAMAQFNSSHWSAATDRSLEDSSNIRVQEMGDP